MSRHEPWVRVPEYIVCAYPDLEHPDAAHFYLRVVRLDNIEGERSWAVYDTGRIHRLGPDGQWSRPPEDPAELGPWLDERRFTEEQALELARQAAPYKTTGPVGHKMDIDAWLAWKPAKGRER